MAKKQYFDERSAREILEMQAQNVHGSRNLVRRIMDLDPSSDALKLMVMITPGKFRIGVETHAEASRKCYKHGDLVALSQPLTQQDAYACPDIPLAIRARDLGALREIHEDEINFVGMSFRPVQGRDRRLRVVPFVWLPEAVRLFGYAENLASGIEVKPYDRAARVKNEGASVVCNVPSRTVKKPRYTIKLEHVPTAGVTERRAVVWSLKSIFETDPEHSVFNIRYTWEEERESSDRFTFYPHDIAAYIATMAHYLRRHNLTPMEMNPFPLVSRREAEFYNRLNNNVIIFDPSLTGKQKFRKLHVAEKSILIARSVRTLGHDETMYWDPSRDGRLRDYDWGKS